MNTARFARDARRSVPFYLLLGAVMGIFLFPFYWGLITSLKFEVDIYDFSGNFLIPKRPSLANYGTLFKTPLYFTWFWNTFLVSAVTTTVSVIISVMAGFAIARLHFRGAALAGMAAGGVPRSPGLRATPKFRSTANRYRESTSKRALLPARIESEFL
jgi:ABC-type glycerol-3-phosphate transport system permease component